jgi:hypothetical protein
MRRIKLKRSSHVTSPARADEPTKREDSPRREVHNNSPKPQSDHSARFLSPKRGHSLSSDEEARSKSKKSKSELSKSKKSRHSRRSRSPKHGHSKSGDEEAPRKSKKSKTKSSRRDRSKSSDDDAPVKTKKSKILTSPKGKSPLISSPGGASKGLSKTSKNISPESEKVDKKLSGSQRLKGMSSATVETMFRDFLTSKISEIEKNTEADGASTPRGSGDMKSDDEDDEKFVDIKEAIKDGTISEYISQKMYQIDQEFQQNLARIQDEDEESGEVISPVESVDSEDVQDPDIAEPEAEKPVVDEIKIETEPKPDDSMDK